MREAPVKSARPAARRVREVNSSRLYTPIRSHLYIIDQMGSPAFERLAAYSLRGRIAQIIREAILDGTLVEGQRLVERRLALELGASLTAVREALIELEMEGFITKRRNAATYVTKLTLLETRKIFAVRKVLEAHAVEQVAQIAIPEQLQRLQAVYCNMVDAARANERKVFLERDYFWHQSIWQIIGNEYLQSALRRLVVPIFASTAIRIALRGPIDLVRDAESHLPILEALKAHDPQAARSAITVALGEWEGIVREYLSQPDQSSKTGGLGAHEAFSTANAPVK